MSALRWSGATDRGRVRKNNEDAFVCLQFDKMQFHYLGRVGETDLASQDCVFAVSDGMGGAAAGEFASRITVEKVTRLLPRSFLLESGHADVLEELFEQIHRALLYLGGSYEECSGMGATLTLCWFTARWMHFAHIGDSRLYYVRDGVLRQLSEDDTHVGWLYRQGKINEHEARRHPGRHSLQRALGAGHQFVDPQVGSVAFEPGDRFLLCTDGATDGLYDSQLLEMHDANEIVRAAVANSGRDNTTALIVEAL